MEDIQQVAIPQAAIPQEDTPLQLVASQWELQEDIPLQQLVGTQ